MVFQGSDWCASCMKLNKEILSTNEFITYSNDSVIILKVDFPKKRKNALSADQQKHNNQLADTYNKNGYFPFVVILDKHGDILGSIGYIKSSPHDYINILESIIGG